MVFPAGAMGFGPELCKKRFICGRQEVPGIFQGAEMEWNGMEPASQCKISCGLDRAEFISRQFHVIPFCPDGGQKRLSNGDPYTGFLGELCNIGEWTDPLPF